MFAMLIKENLQEALQIPSEAEATLETGRLRMNQLAR
jgi:hypothetical protein